MPIIYLETFAGERPKLDPRLLPNEASQVAYNCHFDNGNLSALYDSSVIDIALDAKTKTIFKYLNTHWFSWESDVDVVPSLIANDPYQRLYFTGDSYPKVTNNEIFDGITKPAVSYKLGVQAPEIAIITAVTESTDPDEDINDNEERYYTHTFVTGAGEEGPPGDASEKIIIQFPNDSETFVTLSFSPPNENLSNITHRRIYRSVTGGGLSDYLMVAEIPIADVEYIDELLGEELGLTLDTYDYEMPPSNLEGLCSMANGIMVGFTGNTLYFCEAYLPYAWPSKYQRTTEHNIVAVVPMGNSIAVLTEGFPWIFSGSSPDSISGYKVESAQACLSRKSALIVGGVVMYASPDGLVALVSDGAENITGSIITRKQWQKYEPKTIKAFNQEGRYLGFYGDSECFIFDPVSGDFRHLSQECICGFNSLLDDTLYLFNGTELKEWNSSLTKLSYRWRSKEYRFNDTNFGAVLIRGEELQKAGFKLFTDGKEILHLKPGKIPEVAFRIPSTRGQFWEFELYGDTDIQSIIIGSSMSEIKQVING
ncbi:hypothetical protein [uncultured Psychrosphaera sp.]|uniref:hypothetical protein n=1 Tax=uncultured Psychrosphaera sp. TaxID=1403522 RepID=UPI00261B3589|nr:hypothetical protein [uncultured Psychrosphaera sp.]